MNAIEQLTDRSNWDIQNTYVMGGTNFTVVTWLDGEPPINEAAAELARLQRIEQAARAVKEGWNKGGITGAPTIVEMQRRMIALAAALDSK